MRCILIVGGLLEDVRGTVCLLMCYYWLLEKSLGRLDTRRTRLPRLICPLGKLVFRRSPDVCFFTQDRVEDERTMEALSASPDRRNLMNATLELGLRVRRSGREVSELCQRGNRKGAVLSLQFFWPSC